MKGDGGGWGEPSGARAACLRVSCRSSSSRWPLRRREKERGVLHCINPVLSLRSPSSSTLHLDPLLHRPLSACDNSVLGSSLHQRIFHALSRNNPLFSLPRYFSCNHTLRRPSISLHIIRSVFRGFYYCFGSEHYQF